MWGDLAELVGDAQFASSADRLMLIAEERLGTIGDREVWKLLGATAFAVWTSTSLVRAWKLLEAVTAEHRRRFRGEAQTLALRSGIAQHQARPWDRVKAWNLFRQAAAAAPSAQRELMLKSDAADALDGWLLGKGPLVRARTYAVHARAEAATEPPEAARGHLRAARSAAADRNHDRRLAHLSAGLQSLAGDPWLEGQLLRMRALSAAARGEASGWRDDVRDAWELFAFTGNQVALLDLERSVAICEFLAGDRSVGLRQMQRAVKAHRGAGHRRAALQGQIAAWRMAQTPSLLGRLALV